MLVLKFKGTRNLQHYQREQKKEKQDKLLPLDVSRLLPTRFGFLWSHVPGGGGGHDTGNCFPPCSFLFFYSVKRIPSSAHLANLKPSTCSQGTMGMHARIALEHTGGHLYSPEHISPL